MNQIKFYCILILHLTFCSLLFAATHYVRPGASGNNSGTDWTNAFNKLPTLLNRGDTYLLSDGDYGNRNFSGTGSAIITIKKATITQHGIETGWDNSYGDGVAKFEKVYFNTSNWVLDGQTGGGPGSWKTGHGIEIYSIIDCGGNCGLIQFSPSVGNITVSHVHVHSTLNTKIAGVYGIKGTISNVKFSYNYIHDIFGVHYFANSWSNVISEYNYFSYNKSTAAWHSEFISWRGTVSNLTFRYNIFYKIQGTGVFAGIGIGDAVGWKIYGNIITDSPTPVVVYKDQPSNQQNMSNLEFYNNTITRIYSSQGAVFLQSGSGNKVFNNMWYSNRSNSLAITAEHDYNWFDDNLRYDNFGCNPCDLDPNAVAAEQNSQAGDGNPFTGWDGLAAPAHADFTLKLGTQSGMTLADEFKYDMFGNIRGMDGVWDRGALEYDPNQSTTPLPEVAFDQKVKNFEILHYPNPITKSAIQVLLNQNRLFDQQGRSIEPGKDLRSGIYYFKHGESEIKSLVLIDN